MLPKSNPISHVPKYVQLADQVRSQVKSGKLKPGDQLPSFVELRHTHGISRGTVEKAHDVLVREGLIVREQGRGVFVAQKTPVAATGVLGVVGGGTGEAQSSLYWAAMLSGIQREAALNRLQLMLLLDLSDPRIWTQIDGLLLSLNEEDLYVALNTMPAQMPCVSILAPTEDFRPDVSSVVADDYQGIRDATQHLLDLGHRKIGFLSSGRSGLLHNRLEGYKDALQQSGIEPSLRWARQVRPRLGAPDSKREFVEQGRRTIQEWLAADWRELGCTALLAQNDNVAVGVIEAFQKAGIRVPEDVSVVGFDGTEQYDYFTPALTTVKVPVDEIGEQGARLLVQQINHVRTPQHLVLPTELQIRASSGSVKGS